MLQQLGLGGLVDLVDHDKRSFYVDAIGNPLVTSAELLGGIDQQTHDVDIVDAVERSGIDTFTQSSHRLVQPGSINEHDLRLITVIHTAHPRSSRLWLVRHDAHLCATDGIDER